MKNSEYRILVVDDNTNNIKLLVNLLSEKGYDIEYALNGQDALELVASEDFDLILLDIMMPKMDGFEVCQKIKNNPDKNEIPIIFLTAKTDTESIEKAFEYGGLDYVSKPFSTNELLARVKTHIELKASKDKLKEVNIWLEQKVAERTADLKIANTKLLKLDTAKSEFLKIISHEIRTPLNGILGGIALIEELGFTEESRSFLKMLSSSATRLEEFSYKALDISEFNAKGKSVIKPIETNIELIIENAIVDLEEYQISKEINILRSFNRTDLSIKVDPRFFYKCIYNIIHNALNHSPANGTVNVDLRDKEGFLIIEIKDEGIGFNEEFTIANSSLFASKNHIDKNPGLSLFLANQIVEAHGGVIENGNNSVKGAFVKIIMPIG